METHDILLALPTLEGFIGSCLLLIDAKNQLSSRF